MLYGGGRLGGGQGDIGICESDLENISRVRPPDTSLGKAGGPVNSYFDAAFIKRYYGHNHMSVVGNSAVSGSSKAMSFRNRPVY